MAWLISSWSMTRCGSSWGEVAGHEGQVAVGDKVVHVRSEEFRQLSLLVSERSAWDPLLLNAHRRPEVGVRALARATSASRSTASAHG